MRLGHTVRARSEFAVITNSVAAARFDKDDGSGPGTPTNISGFIADLKRWYRSLPGSLLPENIVFPSRLKLQYVASHPSQRAKNNL
jgi:hypothetical protein